MSTLYIILAVVLGILTGYLFTKKKVKTKSVDTILYISLYFLLFIMGIKIGLNRELLNNLPKLGLISLAFSLSTIIFSVLSVTILGKVFLRNSRIDLYYNDDEEKKPVHNKLTYQFLILIVVGVAFGYFVPSLSNYNDIFAKSTDIALFIMVFCSSIGIGGNKDALPHLISNGLSLLIVPLGIIIGSLIGGTVVALVSNISLAKGMSVGACMGWYSYGGIQLTPIDAQLGLVAFMANIMREIIALFCIPSVAKKFGMFAAIAPAGATAMDTCLPVISKSTCEANIIIAFSTGTILTMLTPILVNFIIGFF